jgi:multimeric flavodoxin WrbA
VAEGPALLRHADAATPADVLAAAGYLFVTPELLGSMAGAMKSCFERSYYPALGRIEGRPYGLIIAAGSDGTGAARQVARIVTGWRLRAVAPPLILVGGATTPAAILAEKTVPAPALARCAELGATLAAGLAMGVF